MLHAVRARDIDYAVLPMSWKQLQPQEQQFNTAALDEWMNAARAALAHARLTPRRAVSKPTST